MRLFRIAAAALLAIFVAAPALAQSSTAQRTMPGYLSTSGCPSAALTPCWLAYSNANPLPVGFGASTAAIGYVGGFNVVASNTPTVQNAAYSASNAIGGWQQVSVFRNTTQPSGILDYVAVASKGGSTTAITIYGFTKSSANLSSTCTDKSAFSLAAADLSASIPGFPVTLTPATTQGATITSASQAVITSVKNSDGTPSQNLTFCAVVGGSVTPASVSDLVFNFGLIQD